MLEEWLQDMTLARFRAEHYGRAPLARACAATAALSVCGWSDLERLLGRTDSDVLVVSRGALTEDAIPRSLPALKQLFARGVGVVVRRPERQDQGLSAFCRALARDLPGQQRVLVFATPGGVNGFGWHYDAEEVFVLQTAGEKTYYMRQNTLDPEPRFGAQFDFSVFSRETSPLMSCTLGPGNLLYIPRGYWHVARPHSDSLSISVGIY